MTFLLKILILIDQFLNFNLLKTISLILYLIHSYKFKSQFLVYLETFIEFLGLLHLFDLALHLTLLAKVFTINVFFTPNSWIRNWMTHGQKCLFMSFVYNHMIFLRIVTEIEVTLILLENQFQIVFSKDLIYPRYSWFCFLHLVYDQTSYWQFWGIGYCVDRWKTYFDRVWYL